MKPTYSQSRINNHRAANASTPTVAPVGHTVVSTTAAHQHTNTTITINISNWSLSPSVISRPIVKRIVGLEHPATQIALTDEPKQWLSRIIQ